MWDALRVSLAASAPAEGDWPRQVDEFLASDFYLRRGHSAAEMATIRERMLQVMA